MVDWSTQQIDALNQYWAEGYPVSQIRVLLSYKFSRNAIIGKVHRMHLKPRLLYRRPKELKPPKPPKEAKPKLVKVTPPQKPKRIRIRLDEDDVSFTWPIDQLMVKSNDIVNIPNNWQCKYIFGDVKSISARWCRKATGGGQWCPEHRAVVYQPLRYTGLERRKPNERYYRT